MSESIFWRDGERFIPTEPARGPWDPRALHGGAPAALLTAAFERIIKRHGYQPDGPRDGEDEAP